MATSRATQPAISSEHPDRSLKLAMIAARVAQENRARDIVVLDMRKLTPVFDYFVVATGSSVRQLHAISDDIEMTVKQQLGDRKLGLEGYTEGGWVLIDFGDVVIHLFDDKSREYYSLEDLWGDAKRVDLPADLSVRSPE